MRRILLTTYGSYGDLHPYIAMARVLKVHGDEVTIATHEDYRDQVERIGVRFVPVKPGLDEVGPQEVWASKANHSWNGIEFILRSLILPYLNDSYQTFREAAVGQDLIISHLLCFAAPMVAEELQIPWVSTILQPASFYSAHDPPTLGFLTILPKLKFLGPKYLGWIMRALAKPTELWLTPIGKLRREIGLPPSKKNALLEAASPYGTLALFSPAFSPPQPDWPAKTRQVGFPLFDEETTSELSPELTAFLAAGPPPIVFTLGTAIVMMETSYYEIAYRAVKALGLRAVFLVGKTPKRVPPEATTDSQIHISAYEPFSKLFPRAAANVHQCGVGTTAQALASGRPQVMVPFAHDQPDNARRVAALGCGVVIPARRLNTRRLINALKTVTESSSIIARAKSFAEELDVQGFERRLLDSVKHFLESTQEVDRTTPK